MIATILSRIGGDPLGLVLTALFLGALWTFVEWGIARAAENVADAIHDDIHGGGEL